MRGWALRALEAEAAEGGREENIEDLEREQAVKGRRGKRPHFANFSALLATLPPLVTAFVVLSFVNISIWAPTHKQTLAKAMYDRRGFHCHFFFLL